MTAPRPRSDWVDEVVVDRLVLGFHPGERPATYAEFHAAVDRLTRQGLTTAETARRLRSNDDRVRRARQRHTTRSTDA